jgi:hypothetical protein
MTAAALLGRLDGVRATGQDRWIAKCPAHQDRRASLSIRELEDGRVLLHDFAGCSVEDILGSIGLDFEALYPERETGHHQRAERKPFRVGELVRALDFELLVAFVVLADVADGKSIDTRDRARARLAKKRISKFLGELRHAA